jgi:hypothetical protein
MYWSWIETLKGIYKRTTEKGSLNFWSKSLHSSISLTLILRINMCTQEPLVAIQCLYMFHQETMQTELKIIIWVLVDPQHYKLGLAKQHTIIKWNVIYVTCTEQALEANKKTHEEIGKMSTIPNLATMPTLS